jgi:hypothetical protein
MKRYFLKTAMYILFIAQGFFMPFLAGAEMDLYEGKWETVMEMTMEGASFKIAPTISTQCITKDDPVPKGSERQKNCKVLENTITGSMVTWKVRCVEKDYSNEGTGEILYSGASYAGKMLMTMTNKKGASRNIHVKMSGKRIGDCPEQIKKESEPPHIQVMNGSDDAPSTETEEVPTSQGQ